MKDRLKQKLAQHKWYQKNKESFRLRNRLRRKENRDILTSIKKSGKCVNCGFGDYRALDFHHSNPAEKSHTATHGAVEYNWSKKRILGELKKCILLCANCHRILHSNPQSQDTVILPVL